MHIALVGSCRQCRPGSARRGQADRVASGQHLGLAAGEHAGAVYAGQQAHFGGQRADLVDAAAVHALALVQQPAAHHELLHLVHAAPRWSHAPHCSAYFSLHSSSSDRLQPLVAHVSCRRCPCAALTPSRWRISLTASNMSWSSSMDCKLDLGLADFSLRCR